MSDQVYYNKPLDQSRQNNNMLWVIILLVVALLFGLFMIFGNADNTGDEVLPTQVPQNPQSTQIPQNPQNTQIPQSPQNTQVPQNPQSTQIPQPTTIATPTVEM